MQPSKLSLRVRHLGRREYTPVWRAMQDFTAARAGDTPDELWLVEHPPVFTLGRNGRRAHVLDPGAIPVVFTDRGGQITYHGPGQAVIYALIDLRRRGMGVRALVNGLQQTVIDFLARQGIAAGTRLRAPGVYVRDEKVAALGLRIKNGCSYHGLSFNVDMDLAPFRRIDPCGYPGLEVTQLKDLGVALSWQAAAECLCGELAREFGYTGILYGHDTTI